MRDLPQEAAHDMLEKTHSLSLDKANDHVTKHGSDGVEALVGSTDVAKASVIKQDLLYDEDGHRFR